MGTRSQHHNIDNMYWAIVSLKAPPTNKQIQKKNPQLESMFWLFLSLMSGVAPKGPQLWRLVLIASLHTLLFLAFLTFLTQQTETVTQLWNRIIETHRYSSTVCCSCQLTLIVDVKYCSFVLVLSTVTLCLVLHAFLINS